MVGEEHVITVNDLRMRYGETDVLDGVSFDVARGEVIALLGPNGAGKTTTIEILEGFRVRSGGDVAVLGADPATADEDWRAGVGIVLQSWRDHGRWKVRDLVAHLGRYYEPYSTAERARPDRFDARDEPGRPCVAADNTCLKHWGVNSMDRVVDLRRHGGRPASNLRR